MIRPFEQMANLGLPCPSSALFPTHRASAAFVLCILVWLLKDILQLWAYDHWPSLLIHLLLAHRLPISVYYHKIKLFPLGGGLEVTQLHVIGECTSSSTPKKKVGHHPYWGALGPTWLLRPSPHLYFWRLFNIKAQRDFWIHLGSWMWLIHCHSEQVGRSGSWTDFQASGTFMTL